MRRGSATVFCLVLVLLVTACRTRGEIITVGRVRIHTPDEIGSHLSYRDGVTYIVFPGTNRWALAAAGSQYHPMPAQTVLDAVGALTFPATTLDIDILILPVPRRDVVESSAEGRVIFLSPGRVAYPEEHVHYTVAHEIGHVIQHLLMPASRQDLWVRYAALREIDMPGGLGAGDHASRPAEIFAEDFRVLFGGEHARCGGNVENHGLDSPESVDGLREFMLSLLDEWHGYLRITAYPNPFQANVVFEAFSLDGNRDLEGVVVYDSRGRRLRCLDRPLHGAGYIAWDGTNDRGESVAPGTYFAVVSHAGEVHLRKIVKTVP